MNIETIAKMECNKKEAFRNKHLAETKLIQKDMAGALKFAKKAHNLFPTLDGLSQLIAVLDVYISAEERVNGEVDWYKVLSVDPLADDLMIKKSYRNLALSLHPDKNKSVAAEGAFKLITEAWSLLSDKAKKIAYDQRRNQTAILQKVVMQKCSMPAGENGFCSSNYPPHPSRPDTYWTACTTCKMFCEYSRDYLNQIIRCYSCREPFRATEIKGPSANESASADCGPSIQQGQPSNSGTAGISVNLKRGREVEMAGAGEAKRKANGSAKKRRVGEDMRKSNSEGSTHQKAIGREGSLLPKENESTGGDKVIFPSMNKPNSNRQLSVSETRDMLMAKARNVILKKLGEINLASKEAVRTVQKENVGTPTVNDDLDMQPPERISMSVPDPDFHDFDQERTEKSFGQNEVWAVYDDDDGMPRLYALIHHVISETPFRLKISWLECKTNSELGPMNWIGSGFRKTSGNFNAGKQELHCALNAFSHKVKHSRGNREGVIRIFPSKGEVWALYKNWASDWTMHTAEDVVHKYEMVVVDEDFKGKQSLVVTPLVKVAGFKSVFRKLKNTRMIPREEIFRFSHQVPSYILTGEEGENIQKGFIELDPAALPLELLEVKTQEKIDDEIGVKKEVPEITPKDENKRIITYQRRKWRKNSKEV